MAKEEIPYGLRRAPLAIAVLGEVLSVSETRTKGGWRRCHVEHEGGELFVESARLPDDAAFERVRDALKGLVRREKRATEQRS